VSFAIPAQEFSRLNVSKRPATWEQLAASARPTPPVTLIKARQSTDHVPDEQASAGNYAAYMKRLDESIGKSVTIVVQEEGRTNTFKFTVK
jgi:hypothetical protein